MSNPGVAGTVKIACSREKGLTAIELAVEMAILAILAAMPTARAWLPAVSVGGTIYAIGGVHVVDRVENEAFTP